MHILSHFCKIRPRLAVAKQDFELFFCVFWWRCNITLNIEPLCSLLWWARAYLSLHRLPSLPHTLSSSLPLNNHPRRYTHGLEVTEKSDDPCLWWHGGFPWVFKYARGAFGEKTFFQVKEISKVFSERTRREGRNQHLARKCAPSFNMYTKTTALMYQNRRHIRRATIFSDLTHSFL